MDLARGIEPIRLRAQQVRCPLIMLDQRCGFGAAGKRLERQRAGAREQIEDSGMLHIGAEPVEQRLANAVHGRPQLRPSGDLELSPFPLTADNAYRSFRHDLSAMIGAVGNLSRRPNIYGFALNEDSRAGVWHRLNRTRQRLAQIAGDLLLGERVIDEGALETLETALLGTDVGVEATTRIVEAIAQRVSRKELADAGALRRALREQLEEMLAPMAKPFRIDAARRPFVVLMVGVNGAGKTTTIGKLARQLRAQGHSVLLAAGDTFRAAAVEQLVEWGRRNAVPVISQDRGADSASVIFDAIEAARARGIDVVLADTAGRLQAKTNLMDELAKVKRIVARFDSAAPHEVILVLDAGIGQNALGQVAQFDAAVGLTGLIVAKLDGSARAGILFAIAAQGARPSAEANAALPVYFIGVGEGVEDLRRFDAREFVDALLDNGREDAPEPAHG